MKTIISFLFILVTITALFPQQSNGWEIYTSMKNVNSITSYEGNIWAATTGGAFQYSQSDDSYQKYTRVNGFYGINLTAITHDNDGNIWFGGSNGSIDMLPKNSNQSISVPDIYNSDRTTKQINSLENSGDIIIAAHDFGISLINAKDKILYDTYFKFGNLTSNTRVSFAAIFNNRIYAANNDGVIIQKEGATNLSAPESWNVYNTTNGLPSNTVTRLRLFQGNILAATSKGIGLFNGTSFQQYIPELADSNITDMSVSNDSLFILQEPNKLYLYLNNTLTLLFTYPSAIKKIDYLNGICAVSNLGVYKGIGEQVELIVPNGPSANQFVSLAVDKNSTLWSASGTDLTGVGFYSFKDDNWTNYNLSTNPEFPSNAYWYNYTAPDNTVYFGSWGWGFLSVKDESIEVYSNDKTGMKGISINPNFVVVTGFGTDSRNNIWVMNYGAIDNNNLTMLTPDSVYHHFNIPALNNQYTGLQFYLVVDQFDTKWFTVNGDTKKGLVYFNENKTYDNTADDKSGILTNFGAINSIVLDQRGDLWVGTNLGVYIVSNLSTALSATPQIRTSSIFSLRQQSINCILVDPLNQKWIGTNEGLLVVNSDGTSLIQAYDTKNSPLLSNIIKSLAIDEKTGRVYVGTNEGIISLLTPSIKAVDSFSEIFVYPSPFKLNQSSELLTIDGLIKDSDIKVISITGKLIKHFSSPGGRTAYWDGRDEQGNQVSSGIYIIVAYDKEGNNVASGKVAVLRE